MILYYVISKYISYFPEFFVWLENETGIAELKSPLSKQ